MLGEVESEAGFVKSRTRSRRRTDCAVRVRPEAVVKGGVPRMDDVADALADRGVSPGVKNVLEVLGSTPWLKEEERRSNSTGSGRMADIVVANG